MNLKPFAWIIGGVSAGMLLYGAFVEAERLVLRRKTIRLDRWPASLNGYRIGLIADFHLRDQHTVALTQRAVAALLSEEPDIIVMAGDFVGYWKPQSPWLIGEAFQELAPYAGRILAVPGNHDYWAGDADLLKPIFDELGIRLLRNESHIQDGIAWLGVDSVNARRDNATAAIANLVEKISIDSCVERQPRICIWHEPDMVRRLPQVCDLMLSGHSHGGQFVFPGGFIPMKTKHGEKYLGGYYPDAPTPLYVTRGIGTTGPPSRFLCPPEIVLLTLEASAEPNL